MIRYGDYEALEFDNLKAIQKGVYPYYLDSSLTKTSLCPIFFSVCDHAGEVVFSRNCFQDRVSFINYLDFEIDRNHGKKHKTLILNFHNIQYDFRIIVHELFYNNFTQIVDSDNLTYFGDYRTEKIQAFSIIGESLSKYIGVNIYYRNWKIMIRDTMSILNNSQADILEAFGFPPKVDINWEEITIDNLETHMPDIEARNIYDIVSLAKALEQFKHTFFDNFKGKGSTAAAMSLDALKYYLCKRAKFPDPDRDDKRAFFKECYPQLEGTAKLISDGGYCGGICLVNPKYAGRILSRLQMVDIHSSYPFAMTRPLPFGKGKTINQFSQDGYSEYVVFISFDHKGIPFQRCHTENRARLILGLDPIDKEFTFTRSQFPSAFTGYMCINSIDLETLLSYADIKELTFLRGVNYATNTVIADFIRPIYEQKRTAKGVIKLANKLALNSLYGKFAQDLSGIINIYTSVNEYTRISAIDNETIYKPLSSAVTAYARRNWVDAVYLLGDDFVYGDTDSAYFVNIEEATARLEKAGLIHEDELGKWGFETKYAPFIKRGKFLSKKNYLLETDDGLRLTCVGLSARYHSQVNFDNFEMDSEPFQIRKMVNIYGGKAMRDTEFRIKERMMI